MQNNYHFYEPLKGHGLRHDPISGIVGPRVIGWIGSQDKQGNPNLAPYSFCNIFNYSPPIIAFASVGFKDSVKNAIDTQVFTWNLANRGLAEQMNLSSISQSVNEFDLTSLTPISSKLINAPRVAESLVNIECKVTKHFQLSDHEGNLIDTWMVLGEAVAVHIDQNLITNGVYHCTSARPILRGGGPGDYYEITDETLFDMRRPK